MSEMLSCFFPTTVVLVDDNPAFLNFLTSSLANTSFTCKAFLDPREALEFVNESSRFNKLDYSNLTRTGEEGTSEWKSILLNINALHSEIYSSARFSKISCVVSDYQMPSMSGVEFCSKILDKDIQRILLTGLAEDKIGIDAFNAGYISRFSRKNLAFSIADYVKQSAIKYFEIYTDYILQHTAVGEFSHLKDPIFADFFSKIRKQEDFVEYYMLDPYGSYLLMKPNGQMKMLSVLTEAEMSRLVDVAIDSDEADSDTLEKLKSRKYMLVYHNRCGTLPPVSEWHKFLRPSGVMEGVQTYYYYLSSEDKPDLDYDEIITFDSFKKNLEVNM